MSLSIWNGRLALWLFVVDSSRNSRWLSYLFSAIWRSIIVLSQPHDLVWMLWFAIWIWASIELIVIILSWWWLFPLCSGSLHGWLIRNHRGWYFVSEMVHIKEVAIAMLISSLFSRFGRCSFQSSTGFKCSLLLFDDYIWLTIVHMSLCLLGRSSFELVKFVLDLVLQI